MEIVLADQVALAQVAVFIVDQVPAEDIALEEHRLALVAIEEVALVADTVAVHTRAHLAEERHSVVVAVEDSKVNISTSAPSSRRNLTLPFRSGCIVTF